MARAEEFSKSPGRKARNCATMPSCCEPSTAMRPRISAIPNGLVHHNLRDGDGASDDGRLGEWFIASLNFPRTIGESAKTGTRKRGCDGCHSPLCASPPPGTITCMCGWYTSCLPHADGAPSPTRPHGLRRCRHPGRSASGTVPSQPLRRPGLRMQLVHSSSMKVQYDCGIALGVPTWTSQARLHRSVGCYVLYDSLDGLGGAAYHAFGMNRGTTGGAVWHWLCGVVAVALSTTAVAAGQHETEETTLSYRRHGLLCYLVDESFTESQQKLGKEAWVRPQASRKLVLLRVQPSRASDVLVRMVREMRLASDLPLKKLMSGQPVDFASSDISSSGILREWRCENGIYVLPKDTAPGHVSMLPFLPQEPARKGDSWSVTLVFRNAWLFGDGDIRVTYDFRLKDFQQRDGMTLAVIAFAWTNGGQEMALTLRDRPEDYGKRAISYTGTGTALLSVSDGCIVEKTRKSTVVMTSAAFRKGTDTKTGESKTTVVSTATMLLLSPPQSDARHAGHLLQSVRENGSSPPQATLAPSHPPGMATGAETGNGSRSLFLPYVVAAVVAGIACGALSMWLLMRRTKSS